MREGYKMPIIIIAALVVLFIIYKVKKDKADLEKYRQHKADRERALEERKKSGEPQVCMNMPSFDSSGKGKMIEGPDGKKYPKKVVEDNSFNAIYYFFIKDEEDYAHKKYEISPLFCMIAMEHYVRENYISGFTWMKPKDLDKDYVEKGFNCIYEVAENYAYSSMAADDLTQAEHYTLRRLQDRKRALQGNGYYKNVYEIARDPQKALWFYEKPEYIRSKYTEYFNQMDVSYVFMSSRCRMQAAHIYAAGGDAEKAKTLYSQAYTIFVTYKQEDQIVELIHAMTSGYPVNPEEYQDQAYNMLADWACCSDLGLAMYYEYVLYANKLDKQRLAQSPEAVVSLCMEQAENNHYAAYLLGRAMFFGYGMPKDEKNGRSLLEVAAGNGCVSALYLLMQLSAGYDEDEKKWSAALKRTVKAIAAKCIPMREQLIQEGKFVSQKFVDRVRQRQAEEAAQAEDEAWEPEGTRDQETQPGFTFPTTITERTGDIWTLDFNYGLVGIYRNMSTGATRTLNRLDIERLSVSSDMYLG